MSFFEWLENLRQKPVEKRRRILFLSMVVSMAVIIIIWVGLLKYQNNDNARANRGPSPWQVIKNTFDTSKDELKKNLPGEVYLKGE